jgi:hypothetical protein
MGVRNWKQIKKFFTEALFNLKGKKWKFKEGVYKKSITLFLFML